MRDLRQLDRYRLVGAEIAQRFGSSGDDRHGAFMVPSPVAGITLQVIAANDEGWDHLSVSCKQRCPNWAEMALIVRMFGKPDETWVQFHVPPSDHINNHPFVLHAWRSHTEAFPRPPREFV